MWIYDEYFKKWYIVLSTNWENDKREDRCKECITVKEIGIDACCGCCRK